MYHRITIVLADEDLKTDAEMVSLAENFREQAAKLVDMLDISIPVVAKLKVCSRFILQAR